MTRYSKHYCYYIVYGNEHYKAEDFYNSRKKYTYLKEARKEAKQFKNAYIIKAHLNNDNSLQYIKEVK